MLIGEKIIRLKDTDSTNDYALKLLKNDTVENGTIVIAGFQLAGKGHSGSSWESERDKNLLMSIVLFPSFLDVQHYFYISKFISLAILNTLKKYVKTARIKWPNDIFLGNKKVAGILIKNSVLQHNICSSVIGIGLNVNQKNFSNGLNATSLFTETRKQINLEEILHAFIDGLNREYELVTGHEFDTMDRRYHENLYRINVPALYRDEKGTFTGIITGVNSYGNLLIDKETGEKCVYGFKEVSFI